VKILFSWGIFLIKQWQFGGKLLQSLILFTSFAIVFRKTQIKCLLSGTCKKCDKKDYLICINKPYKIWSTENVCLFCFA